MKPEVKYKLIEKLIQIEDDEILKEVEAILGRNDELSDDHKTILDERLSSHLSNPNDLLDWEDVKAEIKKKG